MKMEIKELEKIAKQVRRETLQLALDCGEHHIAPSLSTVEILVALYYEVMGPDDKFILSKGHGCLAWYCILRRKGFKPVISGHPDIDEKNGIWATTGSLGHGLPIGLGMAYAKKLKKEPGRVFVLLGDGETQEGSIWESLNIARKLKLDNLVIIVDHNELQALDKIENVLDETPYWLWKKFEAFGCKSLFVGGHYFDQLIDAFNEKHEGIPLVLIAFTTKGKGISFMEGDPKWHSRCPNPEEHKIALKELGG